MLPAAEDDVKTFERFVVSRSQVPRMRETFSHCFNMTQANLLHSRPLGCVCVCVEVWGGERGGRERGRERESEEKRGQWC